jgi:hypothetical protein
VIAPATRLRRESPASRDVVGEVAELLATAYLRVRFPAKATGEVRENEALAHIPVSGAKELEVPRTPSVSATTSPASAAGRPGAPR